MIETRLKLWRSVGAAALLGAGALGLAGCGQGEQGEKAQAQHGEAGEAAIGEAGGEAAIGEGGGEFGEAGAAAAYAGLDGPARTALRLQQLKGFVLVAERVAADGAAPEAGALVGQGILEVYSPAQDQFAGFDTAPLRAAESAGLDGKPGAEVRQRIAAAEQAITRAQAPLNANAADIAVRMIDMSTGIYRTVSGPSGVDPIEYQHSFGAALAARDALVRGETALRARNAARYDEALREMDRLIALWPQATAPERPATHQQMLAQASRVKLALSSFL